MYVSLLEGRIVDYCRRPRLGCASNSLPVGQAQVRQPQICWPV